MHAGGRNREPDLRRRIDATLSAIRILVPMEVRTRSIERSAVTALLPVAALLPFWLLAMAIIWVPFRLLNGAPFWMVPLAWVVLGALLFVTSRKLTLLVFPLLVTLNMIPKVAMGPLIIVWFSYKRVWRNVAH